MTGTPTAVVSQARAKTTGPVAAERGVTEIAARVVSKVAAAAIAEVTDARGAARRVAGVALGSDEAAETPRVDAIVDGQLARVEVTMSVTYPAAIAEVASAVRTTVIERVAQLCGISVRQVDVHIRALLPPPSLRRVQ